MNDKAPNPQKKQYTPNMVVSSLFSLISESILITHSVELADPQILTGNWFLWTTCQLSICSKYIKWILMRTKNVIARLLLNLSQVE